MKMKNIVLAALMAASLWTGHAMAGEPVNVNTATAEEIAQGLDGVGPSKAQAIIDYREANGPFSNPDELVAVKGIGVATVAKNKEYIRLGD